MLHLAVLLPGPLLGIVVDLGVVLRYVFNDTPPYVEQLALLLVISVAMFGAAAGVRDIGPHRPRLVGQLLPASASRRPSMAIVELS